MTLDDAIQQFLEYLVVEKGYSPLTVKAYRRYLARFEGWAAAGGGGASDAGADRSRGCSAI